MPARDILNSGLARPAYQETMTINELPGEKRAYALKAGEGDRYLAAGQLATYVARLSDTGGLLEAAVVSGGKGAALPLHSHRKTHEALTVLAGRLDLWLDGRKYSLTQGDFAGIPPHVIHGYRMQSHRSRFICWSVGGDGGQIYSAIGEKTTVYSHLPGSPVPADAQKMAETESLLDVRFAGDLPMRELEGADASALPDGMTAYVLESGEGQRLIAAESLFTFLAHQGNTAGSFIIVTAQGPKTERIPKHFHEKHTETFYCLEGRMTMWVNDEETVLHAGDFLHAPPGTIHAYRLDAPYTNFVGILTPGLFEPFFRTLCDPYSDYIFAPNPSPLRFDRVIQRLPELDLKFVERPGPRPPASTS
jgi:quercetin 2,3-dioxygenase